MSAPVTPRLDPGRFYELSADLVCIANAEGYFVDVNPAFTETLGYSREELLAVPLFTFIHPDDRRRTAAAIAGVGSTCTELAVTNRYVCKSGEVRWLQWKAVIDEHGLSYGIARDVTRATASDDARRQAVQDLQRTEARLTATLKERDVFLQEVHHRLKNTLQIVSSLINLQSREVPPGDARSALDACGARIAAITLLHDRLHQSADYASVRFSRYAKALAGNLFRASRLSPEQVHLETEVDDLVLPVDRAIPCGLVLNELLGNALRHAFPDGRKGRLHLRLAALPDGKARLTVEDDGVGLPAGFDPRTAPSLGMTLVSSLTRQLGGQLEIPSAPGTTFCVTFPLQRSR